MELNAMVAGALLLGVAIGWVINRVRRTFVWAR